MNSHELVDFLKSHAAGDVAIFGLIKEDTSVIAFGVMKGEEKVRLGSISRINDQWVALQYPSSEEEFRTDDVCKLGWFVWKVAQTNNWPEAFDWMLD